jgi:hypothetical protein
MEPLRARDHALERALEHLAGPGVVKGWRVERGLDASGKDALWIWAAVLGEGSIDAGGGRPP